MPVLHGLVLRQVLGRYRTSEFFWIAILLYIASGSVAPESFGPAAPLVQLFQQFGSGLAAWTDSTIGPGVEQVFPADLPVPPELLLGGGSALALDLFRDRKRRERIKR